MPPFSAGVGRFQNELYQKNRELFEKLSLGQSPEALFITCSDPRIETAMITRTNPGDLSQVAVCLAKGDLQLPPDSGKSYE